MWLKRWRQIYSPRGLWTTGGIRIYGHKLKTQKGESLYEWLRYAPYVVNASDLWLRYRLLIGGWFQVLRGDTPGISSDRKWLLLGKYWKQRSPSLLWYEELWWVHVIILIPGRKRKLCINLLVQGSRFWPYAGSGRCWSAYQVKNIMLLIWKAFQSKEEWRFPFWNIFFRFRDIYVFVFCKWGKWWRHGWFH